MVAGHCSPTGNSFSINGATIGQSSRNSFWTGSTTTDSEAIAVQASTTPSVDCVYESDSVCRRVVGYSAVPYQGETVYKSGIRAGLPSGITGGAVVSPDVNFQETTDSGFTAWVYHGFSACLEALRGDSGSGVYRPLGNGNEIALGVLNAGLPNTSECGGGPQTWMSSWPHTVAGENGFGPLRSGYREASDFSGDGCADVLARSGGQLLLYYGDCNGSFLGISVIGSGWDGFVKLFRTGDFSGDGCADILAIDGAGNLYDYRGDCAGGFSSSAIINTGWGGFYQVLGPGDFNGDGCNDILAVPTNGSLLLYAGNCQDGITAPVQIGSSGWTGFGKLFSPTDWNGDSCNDIIGVYDSGADAGKMRVYQGNCVGGFGTNYLVGDGSWNSFDVILGLGAWNNDACSDLVARYYDGQLKRYGGDCVGRFSSDQVVFNAGWQGLTLL